MVNENTEKTCEDDVIVETIRDKEHIRLFLGFVSSYFINNRTTFMLAVEKDGDLAVASECQYDPYNNLLLASVGMDMDEVDSPIKLVSDHGYADFQHMLTVPILHFKEYDRESGDIGISITDESRTYWFLGKLETDSRNFIVGDSNTKVVEYKSVFFNSAIYNAWQALKPTIEELAENEDMMIEGKIIALKKIMREIERKENG